MAAVGRTRSAIEGLALDDLTLLVRALGHELHLANLAEQVHRLRRRRQRDDGSRCPRASPTPSPHLRDGGVAETEILRAARDDVHLELVLTAHPTEAARRTFLQSQLHLAELLNELDAPYSAATPAQRHRGRDRRGGDDPVAVGRRPLDPPDRRRRDPAGPVVLREEPVRRRGRRWPASGTGTCPARRRRSRSGTWIGGDQDGNPNAGPDDVLRALARSRALLALRALPRRGARAVARARPVGALAGVVDELPASIEARRGELPWVRDEVGVRNATRAVPAQADGDLAAAGQRARRPRRAGLRRRRRSSRRDLDLIDASLRAHHGGADRRRPAGRAAAAVDVFGLHLARLDLRMHAAEVRAAATDGCARRWRGRDGPAARPRRSTG